MSESCPVDVVVVDDDESVRWVIEQTLDLANISYASASNGVRGIQIIEEHAPSLAIIDVKLGAMNGLDVVRSIKDSVNTKVLLVTGYANTIADKLSGLPVLGVLEKPFDIQDLLTIVQQAIRTPA